MEGVQRGAEQYREGHGRTKSGTDRSVERYTEGYIQGCTEKSEDAQRRSSMTRGGGPKRCRAV